MKRTFFIGVMLIIALAATAEENVNSDGNRKKIDITTQTPPEPHLFDVAEPEVMYNTVTQELTITLDPVYYSDYTITLVSDLIEVDYYPFSSVVCLPTSSMSDVVDIYIESDDCGCYAGVLDKDAICGTMGE